jgi:hypothetical protein
MATHAHSRSRRWPFFLVFLGIGLFAGPSRGVILQPGAVAPSDRPADDVVGRFQDNASCVVIASEFILTTRHQVGMGTGLNSVIEVAGATYTVTDPNNIFTLTDPNVPDLMLIRLPGANFSRVAKVYAGTDEVAQTVVIGGYGKGHGEALYFKNDPNIPFGYAWDSSPNTTLRWGQNRVDSTNAAFDPLHGYFTNLLVDDFDEANKPSAVPGEAAIAEFDSGCGWFRNVGGEWQVVGLGWGVDHPDAASAWYDDPNHIGINPDHNYAVRVSDYAGWINGVIPEPATMALVAAGGAMLILRRRARS